MVIVYSTVSLLGGLITAMIVGQHSLPLGILAAPFGGSLSAVAAAALVFGKGGSPAREREVVPAGVVWC
jgi:hypothetical protein